METQNPGHPEISPRREPITPAAQLITFEQLKKIAPTISRNSDVFIPYLNTTMAHYGIDTPKRVAMFLAQILHESGSLHYTQEIASGKAYEGREDLGNNQPGDGVRFKGRGLIQVTGRDNYRQCGKDLGLDLLATPQLLETPQYACLSAGWFWNKKGLNELADTGKIEACTRKINGGLTHLKERNNFYLRALGVLN